ncbi:hypothetical protein GZL_02517 [Streptomyces sp. 769]|nr:hypothetical protein GZL_02517 [Streptomyces sp. 769]
MRAGERGQHVLGRHLVGTPSRGDEGLAGWDVRAYGTLMLVPLPRVDEGRAQTNL